MAAGWLRSLAGPHVDVRSAGSEPARSVNPVAVAAMREVGIDITSSPPRRFDDEELGEVDAVVTMGCGDSCPVVAGPRYLDWPLDDPAGRGIEDVRPIRDAIEARVRELLPTLGVSPQH